MNVYLVEDTLNSPGKIYAVFASKDDAERFQPLVESHQQTDTTIVERHLWYGQPNCPGMNK